MKYPTRLLAEEDDSGSSNSGSAVELKPISEEAVTNEDIDIFKQYHKLGDDFEPRKSVLNKSINDGEEKAKPAKEAPVVEKKEIELSDEDKELLDIDETKVVNAKGNQVSRESADTMRKFKESLKKKAETIAELEKKLKETPQLTENSDFKAIKEENEKLKKQIDDELFEKSEGFTQAFVAPVNRSIEKIGKYFSDIDPDDSSGKEINNLFKKAGVAAKAGNDITFNKILDQIAEDYLQGGVAMKAIFGKDMIEWYDATQAHEKAYSDKSENRKQLTTRLLAEQRKKNVMSVDNSINQYVSEFEISKKAVLDGLNDEERKNYSDLFKGRASKASDSISEFAVNGKINGSLTEIINDGVIAPALRHELDIAWAGYKDVMNKSKIQDKEISDLKAKLAKLSKEPSDRTSGSYVTNGSQQSPNRKSGSSRIFEALSGVD